MWKWDHYGLYGGRNEIQNAMNLNLSPGRADNTQTYHAWSQWVRMFVNTLRPRQDGRHFRDGIFKCIFLNENVRILTKISQKFAPKGPIYSIKVLVTIMAWCWPTDKLLSEPMMFLSTDETKNMREPLNNSRDQRTYGIYTTKYSRKLISSLWKPILNASTKYQINAISDLAGNVQQLQY